MTSDLLVLPDATFDRLARILRDSLKVPVGLVSLVEEDRQVFRGAIGLPEPWAAERQTPLSHSFCQYVVKDAAPLIVTDARTDPRLHENLAIRDLDVIAYAGMPLRDADDHIIGSVCAIDSQPHEWTEAELRTIEDIAHVASAEFRLRSTADALSQSFEQLTMFAGQISHDLKSPLGAVLGFLDLIGEELDGAGPASPRLSGYVDRCSSSARRMVRTIDELLAYSTVGGALHAHPVTIDSIMLAVMDDLRADVGAGDVSWVDATVYADPVQLRCLLQNLVGNGLKFARRDRTAKVMVSATEFSSHTELRVVDNGSGIPVERRDEVLRPMVRLRRDVPGSGLGLATCDRIATAHGGLIQIAGTPGGGTTVVVQLPNEAALDAVQRTA